MKRRKMKSCGLFFGGGVEEEKTKKRKGDGTNDE